MGHMGLTPQSFHAMGGHRVQGRSPAEAKLLIEDAIAITDAGCFALVIEGVPDDLGAEITRAVPVPTFGIGAGSSCDGQVLVFHDIVGLGGPRAPRFVRRYAQLESWPPKPWPHGRPTYGHGVSRPPVKATPTDITVTGSVAAFVPMNDRRRQLPWLAQ